MQPVKRSSGGQSGCLAAVGLIFVLASCAGFGFILPGLHGEYTLSNLIAPGNIAGLIAGGIFGLAFFVVGPVMLASSIFTMPRRAPVTRPDVAPATQSPPVRAGVTP